MNQLFEMRDRILSQMRYLCILSLAVVVSGCFLGRKAEPLTGIDGIEERIAILPVIPEHVVMAAESEKDYAKMARKTNSVLDSLAKGRKSKLIGPKKVLGALEGMEDIKRFNLSLDALEKHSNVSMSGELIEYGKRLKVAKIIRIKVDVLMSANETARWAKGTDGGSAVAGIAGVGKHWSGWVYVTADLFHLSPPRHVTYNKKSDEYWGKMGMGTCFAFGYGGGGCLPFPYVSGETRIRALDQAAREAIVGVLKEPTEDTLDPDPVGE